MSIQPINRIYKGYFFDLDGTLLDTLSDLVVVTNKTLNSLGFQSCSSQQILSYVGNGAKALLRLAMNDDVDEALIDKGYKEFQKNYAEYGTKLTKPYPGITKTLTNLKSKNKLVGILSNKFDQGVKEVSQKYFNGLIDIAYGEREYLGIPRKPDPQGITLILQEAGLSKDQSIYFGDSAVDIETAHNCGLLAVGCLWGYRSKNELIGAGADILISEPSQILEIFN